MRRVWLLFCSLTLLMPIGHFRATQVLAFDNEAHVRLVRSLARCIEQAEHQGLSPEQIDQSALAEGCRLLGINGSFFERRARVLVLAQATTAQSEQARQTEKGDEQSTPLPILSEADYQNCPEIAVTNTNNTGQGSLQDAVRLAHEAGGSRRIVFRLERSDPNFNSTSGTWTIRLVGKRITLREVNRILIDGLSQQRYSGDTNPNGPEVIIDGKDITEGDPVIDGQFIFSTAVFLLYGSNQNWIRGISVTTDKQNGGFILNALNDVRQLTTSGNRLSDITFGLEPDGETLPNRIVAGGILLDIKANGNLIENNTICCQNLPIWIAGDSIDRLGVEQNMVKNNRIGTNSFGTRRLPIVPYRRGSDGLISASVEIHRQAKNNVIEGNIIAGTYSAAIRTPNQFGERAGLGNIIRNNRIGVGPNGENIAPTPATTDPITPLGDKGRYAIGIFADRGDIVENNIIGNMPGAGIQVRDFNKDPRLAAPIIRGNRISNSPMGIQVAGIEGATIEANTIENCSAGVVVCSNPLDAALIYAVPRVPEEQNLTTTAITVTGNTFTNVSGPGIALTPFARNVYAGSYQPNTRTVADPFGPNAYQPSPILTKAERQTDGRIIVTGTASAGGRLEVYASSRAARPGAPDTDVSAYGLGTFVMAQDVAGNFTATIPTDKAAGVFNITATLTVGNQSSEFSRTVAVTAGPPPTDTENPAVAVTAPASGLVVESRASASVSVAWTSSDNVGVTAQSIQFTGKRSGQTFTETVAAGLPGTASSFTLNVRADDAVADAQVVVEARDAAGNIGEGRSGLFTITAPVPADTVKPTVSNVVLNKKKVVRKTDSTLLISWTSSDNVGVVAHDVSFAPDGTSFTVTVAVGLPGDMKSFAWNVPDKSVLPKTKIGGVKVTARDAAGNRGEATSAVVTVK